MSSPLHELPIGAGQGRTQWRPLEAADVEHDDQELDPEARATPAATPLVVELPQRVELVEWDVDKMRKPLQLFGKTVNWQIRRRLQLETDAGRMTEENLHDIGEPLSTIANRFEPTRALAARSVELNLVLAIYEYVQETAVKAGHAKQLVIDTERARASAVEDGALSHIAIDGEVPDL